MNLCYVSPPPYARVRLWSKAYSSLSPSFLMWSEQRHACRDEVSGGLWSLPGECPGRPSWPPRSWTAASSEGCLGVPTQSSFWMAAPSHAGPTWDSTGPCLIIHKQHIHINIPDTKMGSSMYHNQLAFHTITWFKRIKKWLHTYCYIHVLSFIYNNCCISNDQSFQEFLYGLLT